MIPHNLSRFIPILSFGTQVPGVLNGIVTMSLFSWQDQNLFLTEFGIHNILKSSERSILAEGAISLFENPSRSETTMRVIDLLHPKG